MLPQVDVLIPVYKVEQHIGRCLRSVLAQTYPNLRIVLTDDASPDNSIAIAERLFAEENPHHHQTTILRNHTNQGIGAVRKQLINELQGKYALFLDSDDWWHSPETVIEWVAIAEERQCKIVISDYVREYPLRKKSVKVATTPRASGKEHANALLSGEEDAYLWNKLFRTDFLLQYLHFCKKGRNFLEDMAMAVPMLYNAQQVGYYHKPTVHYQLHGKDQLTGRMRSSYIETIQGVREDLEKELPLEQDQLLRKSYELAVARFVMMLSELPFCHYKAIRKSGLRVEPWLYKEGDLKGWIRYFPYRLALAKPTALGGFLIIRAIRFINRFRPSKVRYHA